jgi:hypothetical protein
VGTRKEKAVNSRYEIHSWSRQYREEAIREAQRRHLVERARAERNPHRLRRAGPVWRSVLALLVRGAKFAG